MKMFLKTIVLVALMLFHIRESNVELILYHINESTEHSNTTPRHKTELLIESEHQTTVQNNKATDDINLTSSKADVNPNVTVIQDGYFQHKSFYTTSETSYKKILSSVPDNDTHFLIDTSMEELNTNVCDTDEVSFPTKDCSKHEANPLSFSEFSCKDKCGQLNGTCSCMAGCYANSECCLDIEEHCPEITSLVDTIKPRTKGLKNSACFVTDTTWLHYKMVPKCVGNTEVAKRCQGNKDIHDAMYQIPVHHTDTGLNFRNIFCARCNGFPDGLEIWEHNITCVKELQTSLKTPTDIVAAIKRKECFLQFNRNTNHSTCVDNLVAQCPHNCTNENIKEKCLNERSNIIFFNETNYSNEFCAMCNEVDFSKASCGGSGMKYNVIEIKLPVGAFSFSLLFDITKDYTSVAISMDKDLRKFQCDSTGNCTLLCDYGYQYVDNRCILRFKDEETQVLFSYQLLGKYLSIFSVDRCIHKKFTPPDPPVPNNIFVPSVEFCLGVHTSYEAAFPSKPLNESNMTFTVKASPSRADKTLIYKFDQRYWFLDPQSSDQEYHNETFFESLDRFKKIADPSSIFVDSTDVEWIITSLCVVSFNLKSCYNWQNSTYDLLQPVYGTMVPLGTTSAITSEPMSSTSGPDESDLFEMGIFSIICLSLSICCLFARIVMQFCVIRLQTFSGKLQFCLSLSLLMAYISYIVGPLVSHNATMCKCLAILIHYFYLSSLFWMNIIAIDMYRTFRPSSIMIKTGSSKKLKTFAMYSLYAWGFPAIIVATSLVLDSTEIDRNFKPMYGIGICQLTNVNPKIIFFIAPIGCIILINITLFSIVVYSLRRTLNETAHVKAKEDHQLPVYLKLFVLMGVTWVLGFIGMFSNLNIIWYFFIFFNASQGVFIFISVISREVYSQKSTVRSSTKRSNNVQTTKSVV